MKAKTTKTEKAATQKNKQKKETFVYGYKALDKNLCASAGNGMQFEVGKTYEVEGDLKFCENGFHYCEKLKDVLDYYYPSKELRFVKVKAYGEVLSDNRGSKHLCRKIKVVKELPQKDVLKALGLNEDTSTEIAILGKTPEVRELLALKGLFLNTLVNDEDWHVRRTVAKQGYCLDLLINDKDPLVRRAVAERGYGLDVLVNDEVWRVRQAVADQGYGLDVLVNDKDSYVRRAVAKQGYGLDILSRDTDYDVRRAVAKQGYGLDILINDKRGGFAAPRVTNLPR